MDNYFDIQNHIDDDDDNRTGANVLTKILVDNTNTLVFCTLSGIAFGIIVEKGKVYVPEWIFDQFLLKRYILLKWYAAGIASGMLYLSYASLIPQTKDYVERLRDNYSLAVCDKNYEGVIAGGVILGTGMSLCGSCPGLIFVQIGSFTRHAMFTLAGACVGIVAYGYAHPHLEKYCKLEYYHQKLFLHEYVGKPYHITSLIVASSLSAIVLLLELISPYTEEANVPCESVGALFMTAWPPSVCGILTSGLQTSIHLAFGTVLDNTNALCVLVSQFTFVRFLAVNLRYLSKYVCGVENVGQVSFLVGTMTGSFISSTMSHTYGGGHTTSCVCSFLGGGLMLFGGRLVGTNSGQGLTGVALLSKLSLAAVGSTAASFITSGCLFRALNIV